MKILKEVLSAMILAIIPVTIVSISQLIFGNNVSDGYSVIIIFFAYVICAIILFWINKLLPKLSFFRPFRQYEGRWIEVILDSNIDIGNIAICDFYFENGTYHYDGKNFKTPNDTIPFKSKKFIEDEDGFFYVTQTINALGYEGLGKVIFHKPDQDDVLKGEGYFIDVLDKPSINKTKMFKIDQNFCKKEHLNESIMYESKSVVYNLIKDLDFIKRIINNNQVVK